MKRLLTIFISALLLVAVASCAAPEATTPAASSAPVSPAPPATTPAATTSTTTQPATTSTTAPVVTVTPTPTSSTIGSDVPGYTTYSSQDWLLVDWVISELSIEPEAPVAAKPVQVWADIYISSGDIPMSFIKAELIVNGEVVNTKTLTLWYDDSLPIFLTFTPPEGGDYDVTLRVNMLENESYAQASGEDLSIHSSATVTVAAAN